MLPSTGYFKAINCPFYECGSCDRPYCHFKHARREDGNTGTAAGTAEARTTGQAQEPKSSDSDVLQRLVTEAVKKVLANHDGTTGETISQDVVSQVVEGLAPCVSTTSAVVETKVPNTIGKHLDMPVTITKPVPCVYNPTPIAELKKRHIPIATYMPTRESRPTVKRKSSPDRPKPWLSVVNDISNSHAGEIVYKPTAIVNTNEQGYVPTCKSDSTSLNTYEDSNINDYLAKCKEEYHPKSKKRREEYVPKKVKAPLTGQLDIRNEILTTTVQPVQVLSNEDSQESYIDIDAKFSDDECIEETNKTQKAGGLIPNLGKVHNKDMGANRTNDTRSIIQEQEVESDKRKKVQVEIDPASSNKRIEEKKSVDAKATEVKKSTKDDKKEHRKRSRSRSKERKSGRSSSSSHKSSSSRYKSKHKHDSSSDRKHQTTSQSKDKDKNRDNHKSKESSSRKEKHSTTEKSKDDHRKSDKHRRHDSKSSSSKSSRSDKRSSEKSHEKRQSSSSHKSSRHSSKNPKPDESKNEERDLSDESQSGLENIQSFLDLGCVDEEENGIYEIDDEDEVLTISDSDHDVQEECLKIFQEYEISEQPKPVSIKESAKREEDTAEEVGKKRVAHPSAATQVSRQLGPAQSGKKLATPQEKMYERWRLMKEAAATKAASETKPVQSTNKVSVISSRPTPTVSGDRSESTGSRSTDTQQVNGNGRIRIAHVPYARSLALQKKKVAETVVKQAESKATDNRTAAQTSKGGSRVAHIPQVVPQLVRPEPLSVATQKFPLNVRQYYINIMHDICIQIYTNGEDAAQRALKEELTCHEKCKALPVYKNSCMLAAHRLRKEVDQNTLEGPTTSGSGMVSHEAVLAGKSKGSWSVLKTKKSITDIKGTVLYCMLKKWIMTEQQLRDNGFPRPHPDGLKGRAKVYVINTRNQTILSKVPNERFCGRCGQTYMTDKEGVALRQQNCIYHWGRKFTIRGEGRYSCCQQYGSATGCCEANTHVWDYTDYENLRGYVRTLPRDIPQEDQGVFALDCEMCYTTQGLELTRVTVIDEDSNVVYETLVKPHNPIIDYNTRFSGITEEDMKNVTTTLLDVQATLLTMFSDKTILVGHSLESDFKAMKLLHDTVVDTSIMFPHKNGYPQKRALKNLCSEYLRKIIQNDVGGHDSNEDAVSCMELILWKVREEAKLQ